MNDETSSVDPVATPEHATKLKLAVSPSAFATSTGKEYGDRSQPSTFEVGTPSVLSHSSGRAPGSPSPDEYESPSATYVAPTVVRALE